MEIRRVITGCNAQGRSAISADGAAPAAKKLQVGDADVIVTELWAVDGPPLLDGPDPTSSGSDVDMALAPGAVRWRTVEFPPGAGSEPFFHATPTLDLGVVVSGEIELLLDDGTRTLLKAGDTFVQRGTNHAWHNGGEVACVLLTTNLGCGT